VGSFPWLQTAQADDHVHATDRVIQLPLPQRLLDDGLAGVEQLGDDFLSIVVNVLNDHLTSFADVFMCPAITEAPLLSGMLQKL